MPIVSYRGLHMKNVVSGADVVLKVRTTGPRKEAQPMNKFPRLERGHDDKTTRRALLSPLTSGDVRDMLHLVLVGFGDLKCSSVGGGKKSDREGDAGVVERPA